MRILMELLLFAVFATGFLGSVQLFLAYRLRQAGESRYVPHSDPWLPAIMALSGLGAIALVGFFA